LPKNLPRARCFVRRRRGERSALVRWCRAGERGGGSGKGQRKEKNAKTHLESLVTVKVVLLDLLAVEVEAEDGVFDARGHGDVLLKSRRGDGSEARGADARVNEE
jgi:hypothetical protein